MFRVIVWAQARLHLTHVRVGKAPERALVLLKQPDLSILRGTFNSTPTCGYIVGGSRHV